MENKLLLSIVKGIILMCFILFALAGIIYLIGNIVIGCSLLTFDLCISFSGIVIGVINTIILIRMERNKGRK